MLLFSNRLKRDQIDGRGRLLILEDVYLVRASRSSQVVDAVMEGLGDTSPREAQPRIQVQRAFDKHIRTLKEARPAGVGLTLARYSISGDLTRMYFLWDCASVASAVALSQRLVDEGDLDRFIRRVDLQFLQPTAYHPDFDANTAQLGFVLRDDITVNANQLDTFLKRAGAYRPKFEKKTGFKLLAAGQSLTSDSNTVSHFWGFEELGSVPEVMHEVLDDTEYLAVQALMEREIQHFGGQLGRDIPFGGSAATH